LLSPAEEKFISSEKDVGKDKGNALGKFTIVFPSPEGANQNVARPPLQTTSIQTRFLQSMLNAECS
jgi:hypothetical protein